MNKKELVQLRSEIKDVLDERMALGEFDANSKYMMFLLENMIELFDHAISQQPKPVKKK